MKPCTLPSSPYMTSEPIQTIPLKTIEECMRLDEAEAIAGRLSNPSKMPGMSWGISAKHCKTGSKLAKIKGTACRGCYARKGNYCRTNVEKAMERRLQGLSHPLWKEAMEVLISHNTSIAVPYFRWFDSGDLQSYKHLLDILWIARRLPTIYFWMPTQERRYLRQLTKDIAEGKTFVPSNIVIRYSSPMLNQPAIDDWPQISVVRTDDKWDCPSMTEKHKGRCQDCRRCWDPNEKIISYKKH